VMMPVTVERSKNGYSREYYLVVAIKANSQIYFRRYPRVRKNK
jgi:hypothetical protein